MGGTNGRKGENNYGERKWRKQAENSWKEERKEELAYIKDEREIVKEWGTRRYEK